jgi:hypothetical protein
MLQIPFFKLMLQASSSIHVYFRAMRHYGRGFMVFSGLKAPAVSRIFIFLSFFLLLFSKDGKGQSDIRFKRFAPDQGLSMDDIRAITQDSKGNFWIGTKGGLNLMDRETGSFTSYSENDGFTNNSINSIVEDTNGNLWLGTNKGLSTFNPAKKHLKIIPSTMASSTTISG